MPGIAGVAATREITRAAPGVGILMLTMLDDDESVHAALHAGAAGYVLKGDSQEQIVRAIHAVADGDAILGSGAGLSSTGIAARLGLAAKTVNNNHSAIYTKLGVAGRTEAALLARRSGLGERG